MPATRLLRLPAASEPTWGPRSLKTDAGTRTQHGGRGAHMRRPWRRRTRATWAAKPSEARDVDPLAVAENYRSPWTCGDPIYPLLLQ